MIAHQTFGDETVPEEASPVCAVVAASRTSQNNIFRLAYSLLPNTQ